MTSDTNMDTTTKLHNLRNVKEECYEKINQLKGEISFLKSFADDAANAKNILKVWSLIDEDDKKLDVPLESEIEKIKLNFEVSGIKMLKFNKKLIHIGKKSIESQLEIHATYKSYVMNIIANLYQANANSDSNEQLSISELNVQFDEDLAEELKEFIQKVIEDRALQRFIKYFPMYCEARDARRETIDYLIHRHGIKTNFDQEKWILNVNSNIHSPKVIVQWIIKLDAYGCIEVDLTMSIEPTGWNEIFDKIPKKLDLMKKVMGDSQAVKSIIDAICTND